VARNCSGWVRTSTSTQELGRDAAEAIAAAYGPPGQIATLILPADVSWPEGAPPARPIERPAPPVASSDVIEQIASVLRGRGESALFLGGRALREPGLKAATQIAHATGTKLIAEVFPTRIERGAGVPPIE